MNDLKHEAAIPNPALKPFRAQHCTAAVLRNVRLTYKLTFISPLHSPGSWE